VIADVQPKAAIAQEEIFGPVLAVIKSRNFEDALSIANNTEFGLTGAIFSTSREKIDRPSRSSCGEPLHQPEVHGSDGRGTSVGGFNMSGTDSKAGGPDYLYLFTQAKSVAEKLS